MANDLRIKIIEVDKNTQKLMDNVMIKWHKGLKNKYHHIIPLTYAKRIH